jgi:hypothetical protein
MISQSKHFLLIVCLTLVIGICRPASESWRSRLSSRAQPDQPVCLVIDRYTEANDGSIDTRATSGKADYVGMSVTIDAGGLQNIIGVKQEFGPWATHHPGAYKVEVAESLAGPWMTAFEGPGERGESRAEFPAILARYVRITATAKNTTYRQDWSIAELKLGVDPGQKARRISARPERPPETTPPPVTAPRTLKDITLATDKNPEHVQAAAPNYEGMSITIDLGGEYELS